ncbi:hypothetical protein [Streptomyces mirabilis]|uniref:hypothetical protein n=1 Tax=Streptomyces mirabilis TaxID=68239 RepID=UPI003683E4F2
MAAPGATRAVERCLQDMVVAFFGEDAKASVAVADGKRRGTVAGGVVRGGQRGDVVAGKVGGIVRVGRRPPGCGGDLCDGVRVVAADEAGRAGLLREEGDMFCVLVGAPVVVGVVAGGIPELDGSVQGTGHDEWFRAGP